jgi:hypothetical protein
VTRRHLLFAAGLPLIGIPLSAAVEAVSIRGRLARTPDGHPALEVNHKLISLSGDEDTSKVLEDSRIAGSDFEAIGHFTSPDHLAVDGIYTRSMFVYKEGKKLLITYWCDVCYIRTYSPGKCVCCQKYTDLDLREHDDQ